MIERTGIVPFLEVKKPPSLPSLVPSTRRSREDRKQESASLDRVRGDGRSMERERAMREIEMGEYFVGEICHFYH